MFAPVFGVTAVQETRMGVCWGGRDDAGSVIHSSCCDKDHDEIDSLGLAALPKHHACGQILGLADIDFKASAKNMTPASLG